MPGQAVIWITIGVYFAFMLAVGLLSRRRTKSMGDFAVGGRSAGAWVSALSYGTAYFSAVMFIGYAGGTGWKYGLWGILPGCGQCDSRFAPCLARPGQAHPRHHPPTEDQIHASVF